MNHRLKKNTKTKMGYMQTKAMVVKINFLFQRKKKVLTKTEVVALSLPPLKTTTISFNTQSFYAEWH